MMDVNQLVFETRDVVTIVIGVGSFLGFYYALKRAIEKLSHNVESMEEKYKTEMNTLSQSVKDTKDDMNKKEEHIYQRINEIREEQKSANEKLEYKIDAISTHLTNMNTSLSELTGYIKAKKSA
jgi:uncharacterized membrane protein YgaE (UPF0421/DUF939 family)